MTAADLVRIVENGQLTTDGNTQIVVQAVGYATDGSMTTLEALIVPVDAPAIIANGDLTVQGNPDVVGTNGSVHANADLYVGGSATVSGNATATGGYKESGNPSIGGYSGGAQSTQPVPQVNALDYKPLADYILTSDGKMTDGVGIVMCDASADANACEAAGYMWVFAGANGWTATSVGANSDDHTYYAETDLAMTGNMGSNGNPLNITLIAEGNIKIAGNGVLEADTLVTDNRVGGNAMLTNNGTLLGTGFSVTAWREL